MIRVTKATRDAARGEPYAVAGASSPGPPRGRRPKARSTHRAVSPCRSNRRRACGVLLAHDAAGNIDRQQARGRHGATAARVIPFARCMSGRRLGRRRAAGGVLSCSPSAGSMPSSSTSRTSWARSAGTRASRWLQRIGAEQRVRPPAGCELLHARGARVIGRIVAFRDPMLAQWAWTRGRQALVIQAPDGPRTRRVRRLHELREPGSPVVQHRPRGRGGKRGVDDILYDYVRRPDGPIDDGRSGPRRGSVGCDRRASSPDADERSSRSAPSSARRVFGIAATRPDEIAQDVAGHRPRGRLRRADGLPVALGPRRVRRSEPEAQPFAIVRRSLPTSGARCAARARASCRGSRTSRSASITAPRKCGRRSTPPAPTASTSSCSGTRASRTRNGRSTRRPRFRPWGCGRRRPASVAARRPTPVGLAGRARGRTACSRMSSAACP